MSQLSFTDEEILEALLHLQLQNTAITNSEYSNEFIAVSDLINRLMQSCSDTTAHSSVLNAINRKLASEKGGGPWLEFQPYKGVCFTEKGLVRAKTQVRKHRLAERLLVEILGFPIEEAHREACRLEHSLSDKVVDRIEEKLIKDSPTACPHGLPIPTKSGHIPKLKYKILTKLQAPMNLILRGTLEDSDEFMSQVHQMGFTFGMKLHLKANQPNSDFLIFSIIQENTQKEVIIPKKVGSLLLVEPFED